MKAIVSELKPTDHRKSFYGKATLYTAGSRMVLRSYSTLVAGVDMKTGKVSRYSGWDSATTRRHVKSFLDTVGSRLTTKEFWGLKLSKTPEIMIVG